MTPAQFLETRTPAWDRLEMLIGKTRRRGATALDDGELHELTRLYPAVAVDVARARTYKLDPKTQERVNRLAIAAHGLLYRRKITRPVPAIWRFFAHEYPPLFRRLWPYMVLSTALFLVGAVGAYLTTRVRPSAAYLFVPHGLEMPAGDPHTTAEDISERFRQIPQPPMAAGIITNNISVAFNAFAFGITAGVGTCYVILFNGMMLGGFAGHFVNHQLGYELCAFIAPHGILEILTILIAAAAGLRLGISLAIPGSLTRMASLRTGAREAVLLVLGTIPMFILAGMIEGFITPSYMPGGMKIALGLIVGGMVIAYLLLVGRSDQHVGVSGTSRQTNRPTGLSS